MAVAVSAARASASASRRLLTATPLRWPTTARTRTCASLSNTFWWIPELAKRVSALSSAVSTISVCSAGDWRNAS
jgi:hypothetical protein